MRMKYLILTLTVLSLAACSETKYVAEGEYLLDRVRVMTDVKVDDMTPSEMKDFVRQRGNSRWFSALKIPLYTYSLSGRDTTRWLNRTLRSIGEAPVIYDSAMTRQSMLNIHQQMQNRGYLQSEVKVYTETHGKKLRAIYLLHPGPVFRLRRVDYDIQDTAIARLLQLDNPQNRGLRAGMKFNVDNLDNERKRITQLLSNQGYYRFNKDYISFLADSVAGTTDIDLTLVLHRYRKGGTVEQPHQQYHINQVRILSGNPEDSVLHLRPNVLRSNNFIRQGQLYSASDLQSTYNHFGRLGAVRYTNISLREHPDTALLDCDIAINTNKPSTISFQPEGTNTAGDLGAAASLTYQNRNLFRGSENLSIELRGAYEAIRGLEGYASGDFKEYSLGARLTFPRFIAPFLSSSFRQRINATSEVSVLYDLQDRPEFRRRVFTVGWRYKWFDQNHHDRYRWDLLDLNYISMPWISDTFKREYLDNTTSRNSILRYNYQDLFIMRTGFGYTYNNGRWVIKAAAETSGNLLNLMATTLRFHQNEQEQYTFLNIAYAQYVKGDFEYTRNLHLSGGSQLVFHTGLGLAYPYGNSSILPFEKRYFSGGANSLRGWSVRSIGPGGFRGTDGRIDFINQTGDMKLDLNLEYRAKLFWKLHGALFVDAGNIWTLRSYADQPDGQFRFSTFLKQLAASYGLGIRLNFDYFIVRFDMGMKAVNPAYDTEEEHFPIAYPRLSRDFAFHFAVGMPF